MEEKYGDNGKRGTPVPIPNTEVKPLSADGTEVVTLWESRTSPNKKRLQRSSLFLFGNFAIRKFYCEIRTVFDA